MSTHNNKPGATGLTRIINAFGYSLKGLKAAFINEAAFRQELLAFIVLAPLAIWLGQSGVEQALLIGSLFLVLIAELINSAIEAVVDRFGKELHELSGRAKDIGSATVLIAMLNLFVVWVLVLYPQFF
ncbi:MAG: diacylglycerol kinase [Chromatiales bacterium]|nr:diacylglycerol kinase [Chromatiales bacterium]